MPLHDFPPLAPLTVDPSWVIAIVRSVWYGDCTQALSDDAVATLVALGIPRENIRCIDVSGSYEIPLVCRTALDHGADGALAFGIVMQGDTEHAHHVTAAVAHGIMDVQLTCQKPVLFEVLHVRSKSDADARAVGPGAKGPFAARALLHSLATLAKMRS